MGARIYEPNVAKARNKEKILRDRLRWRLLALEFERRYPQEFVSVRRRINRKLDKERGPIPGGI
jgi:hypothetical protein